MYNLQEKKAWVRDLVCQLTLPGPDNKEPRPKTSLSSADGNNTPGLLKLEDLALFKMNVFRVLFVAKSLQIHAASGKGHIILKGDQFDLITDIFRVILREGNNENDFVVIRMVYQASGLFGIYVGEHVKTVRMALGRHEAWRNKEFWTMTLDELVARDMQRWMNLQWALQEVFGFAVSNDHIIKLMVSFRLKSLVRTMLELRTPFDLIDAMVVHSKAAHEAEYTSTDICEAVATPTSLWLLDVAVRASTLPTGPGGLVTPDPEDMADALRSMANNSAAASLSTNAIVKWTSEMTLRASHWSSLGFSIYHELFRLIVEKIAANPKRLWAVQGPVLTRLLSPSNKVSSPKAKMCICGRPYRSWRPIGGFAPQLENIRHCPSFLCEGCFRLMFSERRLSFETTFIREGTMLPTLRFPVTTPVPPQMVGCASIPDSEIDQPMSVTAFWKLSAPVIHTRKSSRDRLMKKPVAGIRSTVAVEGNLEPTSTSPQEGTENNEKASHEGSDISRNGLTPEESSSANQSKREILSILKVGIEILKHGRFGRPHLRTFAIDSGESQLSWCKKEETPGSSHRNGLQLCNLLEVKIVNERKRLINLTFRERPLVIEATSPQQFALLLTGFRALIAPKT